MKVTKKNDEPSNKTDDSEDTQADDNLNNDNN